MRKLLAVLLLALMPVQASAHVIFLVNDMTLTDPASGRNMGPFWALVSRSMARGQRYYIYNNAALSLAELRDSVSVGASNPLYNAGLIVVVNPDRLASGANLPAIQITKNVNRPKVPVMYINTANNDGFQNSGNESLGTTSFISAAPTADNLLTTPAGYAFPFAGAGYLWKRGASGAYPAMGSFVTPVAWLAGYNFTRADPDGVGGSQQTGAASDTMAAWFYNPPIVDERVGIGSTTGYGCIGFDLADNNSGVNNFPNATMATIAVGMMKRLAPAQFEFPGVNVALDVDDGCKRFGGVASQAQIDDYLAGIDSLNANGIKFTMGVEVDSMGTLDPNGSPRFVNESAHWFAKDLGKVTVHCHRGTVTNAGGAAADTSEASASGHRHSDIFGASAARRAFGAAGDTSVVGHNRSIYALLNDAQKTLIAQAGDIRRVSRHVMAPGDNYRSRAANMFPGATYGGGAATLDSIFCAIAQAGYTVVRSQLWGNSHNMQTADAGGGINYGRFYPLPMLRAVAIQNGITPASTARGLLIAPSNYIVGGTTDTTTASAIGSWRNNINVHLGCAFGFVGNFDANTDDVTGARAGAKETIYVTHCPNWRQASGAASAQLYGGGRIGWDSVRPVHAAMMAAKWAADPTGATPGPVRWVWSDEITPKDIR